jgi:hypothetical protein
LSTQIHSDDRIFFQGYDKYLSYGMFVLATVATASSLVPISEAYLPHFAKNVILVSLVTIGFSIFVFTGNRVLDWLGKSRWR